MSTLEMMRVYLDEEVAHSYELSYSIEWEEGEDDWRTLWLSWTESRDFKVPFVGSPADLRDLIDALTNERPRGCGWVRSVKVTDNGRA